MKKLTYLLFAAAILMISCTSKGSKVPEEANSSAEEFQRLEDSIKQVIEDRMAKYPKDSTIEADYIDYMVTSNFLLEGNPAPR